MNKQELIDELKKEIEVIRNNAEWEERVETYGKGKRVGLEFGWKLAKKLDEPEITEEQAWEKIAESYPANAKSLASSFQHFYYEGFAKQTEKPAVPQFVADWYEENKENLELNIYCLIVKTYESCKEDRTEIQNWANWEKNKPIETLIRMRDGYTIEPPKKYRVKVSEELYFVRYDELEIVVIRGNAPMFIEIAKVFDNKEEAEKVADDVNGHVEKLPEDEAMKLIEGWKG